MSELTSNTFSRGMNQDIHPKFQPEGTYRMALNAIIESSDGDLSTITNELGNELWATLPANKKIIGHKLLNDNTVVLCLYSDTSNHEIGIFDSSKKEYVTVLSGDFNFSNLHYVNIIYRLKNGCERILYLTDNYNEYRVINIDRPEYYTDGITTAVLSFDKFAYSREYLHPNINVSILNSGGALALGVYRFAYRLLDQDKNPTDWFFISNPISISGDSELLKDDLLTVNKYDGGVNVASEIGYKPLVNKSVQLNISNVDSRFQFIQLAAIQHTSSSGALTKIDVLTPSAIVPNNNAPTTLTYVYTGYDSQTDNQASLDEIFSERQKLYQIVAHEIKDGKLFVANSTNKMKDYTGFQRHASKIRTEWVEQPEEIYSPLSKEADYYFGNGSFTYDEVEALGIVYI